MRGTPLISRSIGSVTERSTSSGAWPGYLRDDLHLHVLHVGKRLDRQVVPAYQPEIASASATRKHEHALLQRKRNEAVKHRCSADRSGYSTAREFAN